MGLKHHPRLRSRELECAGWCSHCLACRAEPDPASRLGDPAGSLSPHIPRLRLDHCLWGSVLVQGDSSACPLHTLMWLELRACIWPAHEGACLQDCPPMSLQCSSTDAHDPDTFQICPPVQALPGLREAGGAHSSWGQRTLASKLCLGSKAGLDPITAAGKGCQLVELALSPWTPHCPGPPSVRHREKYYPLWGW